MKIVPNPAEIDDQRFLITIELLKQKLSHLQCPKCKEESTIYFAMYDPSFKKIHACCDDFTKTIFKEMQSVMQEIENRPRK